jgi:hypothetical protein
LKGLKGLRVLDLRNTKVTDAGLKELRAFPELRTLAVGLHYCVTDDGLREIAALKQLRTLYLHRGSSSRWTPAGVEDLRKALPNCTIISW